MVIRFAKTPHSEEPQAPLPLEQGEGRPSAAGRSSRDRDGKGKPRIDDKAEKAPAPDLAVSRQNAASGEPAALSRWEDEGGSLKDQSVPGATKADADDRVNG
ncbi:hypothetical protein [Rhizobium sp. TRM95796]|uniref:hypothetical protein n=1 Tax=Rhizobium sp. TRM95796 TaxID=2979862 RepID=UPI0021E80F68|nr:hypothetical protein [Rhizobium sp. TRM95796]MCV3768750.1 hypothetical protein [Rhizobium sp. TRM95796]